jgi:hypothetical protein
MHRGGAPQGLGADLGEADVTHIAGLHHLRDRADGVLDRHPRVEPRRPVHVDVLDPEPLERVGEKGLHRRRPRVQADPPLARIAQGAELDADPVTIAREPTQRLGDQHLVVPHAVEVAGVEQVDAGVERRMDRGDALGAVGGPVKPRHAHASEAEGGNRGSSLAKLSRLHLILRSPRRRAGPHYGGWHTVR